MMSSKIYELLGKHDIGSYLDRAEFDMIFSHNKIVEYNENDIILQQGKTSHGVYIILEGTVAVEAQLLGKGKASLETYGPGDILGEIRFIEQTPCGTSIIARSRVKCLLITNLFFEMLSLYYPDTKHKLLSIIIKQVSDRIKSMHDNIAESMSRLDMMKTSLLSDMVNSLSIPKQITLESAKINLDYLRRLEIFKYFTDSEIACIFDNVICLDVLKHNKLISENSNKCACYIVVHGAIRTNLVKDNKIAKLSIIGPDSFFSSISCANKEQTLGISFVACERAILLEITEDKLTAIQQNKKELWGKLTDNICRSFVSLEKSVDKLAIRLNIETYNR